jgi:cytochrome P450
MSSNMTFFYIMAAYPDIQRKAQAEIDRVVGPNRLPNFEDRESLPYIEAVYREIMRWMPPTQLGVPRRASEDDYYKGYFIPKGTSLLIN